MMHTSPEKQPLPQWPASLLLVDDDEEDYYLLSQAVQVHGLGLSLIHQATGLGLVERLAGLEQLPDLILVDFQMPSLSGLELLTLLKQAPATRQIPVVMWSNFLDPQEQEQCYRQGASGVLLKPDNQFQLIKAVENIYRLWLAVKD